MMYQAGLVLEGGALRTIFSSGVCDAFLNEKLPMPDYTIGVSAGIAYGVSYLSRQKRPDSTAFLPTILRIKTIGDFRAC